MIKSYKLIKSETTSFRYRSNLRQNGANNNLVLNLTNEVITGTKPCSAGTTYTVSGVRKSSKIKK